MACFVLRSWVLTAWQFVRVRKSISNGNHFVFVGKLISKNTSASTPRSIAVWDVVITFAERLLWKDSFLSKWFLPFFYATRIASPLQICCYRWINLINSFATTACFAACTQKMKRNKKWERIPVKWFFICRLFLGAIATERAWFCFSLTFNR